MRDTNAIFYHGFPVRGEKFLLPPDTASLDPKTKREVTICNLFINHKLSVPEIVRVLDEDYRHIVNVLLNSRVVDDRRQRHVGPPEGIERRRSQYQPVKKGRSGIFQREVVMPKP
jgi:hypothetical protein